LVFNGYSVSTIGSNFSAVVFKFHVSPELLWSGLKWALGIGLVGGLFPALRAARLPVTTALRETCSTARPLPGGDRRPAAFPHRPCRRRLETERRATVIRLSCCCGSSRHHRWLPWRPFPFRIPAMLRSLALAGACVMLAGFALSSPTPPLSLSA